MNRTISYISGGTDDDGFSELAGGYGGRHDILPFDAFDADTAEPTSRFHRTDTGETVEVTYHVSDVPDDGLAIKNGLDDYYEQEINHGRPYPNLDGLANKGLLEQSELDKRTKVYTVIRRGQREIETRREWENQYLESKESVPP